MVLASLHSSSTPKEPGQPVNPLDCCSRPRQNGTYTHLHRRWAPSQQAGIEARYDKTRQSQMAVSKTHRHFCKALSSGGRPGLRVVISWRPVGGMDRGATGTT